MPLLLQQPILSQHLEESREQLAVTIHHSKPLGQDGPRRITVFVLPRGSREVGAKLAWTLVLGHEIEHGADTSGIAIDYQKDIKVGTFLNVERPTWNELSDQQHHATLGDRYYRAAQMKPAEKEEVTHAQS